MSRSTHYRPARHFRWAVVVLGFAGSLAAAALATLVLGGVSGEEFSPDTFARRSFRYYEIPLLRLQITPVRHLDVSGDLEQHLIKNALVPKQRKQPGPVRWDLVYGDHSGAQRTFSDATILCNYLDAEDADGKSFWLQWTKQHPQRAPVLWNAVAELARANLYLAIPDLFLVAQTMDETTDFSKELEQAVATRLHSLAESYQRLEREQAVVELCNVGLRLAPDHPQLRALKQQVESKP